MDNQDGRSFGARNDLFQATDSLSSLSGNDNTDESTRALRTAVQAVVRQNSTLLASHRAANDALLLRNHFNASQHFNVAQRSASFLNPFLRVPNALSGLQLLQGNLAQQSLQAMRRPILPAAVLAPPTTAAPVTTSGLSLSASAAGILRKRLRQDPPGVVYTIDCDSADTLDTPADFATRAWKHPRVDEVNPTVPSSSAADRVKALNFSKSVDPAGVTADSEEFQEMKKRHFVDLLDDDEDEALTHARDLYEGPAPAAVTSGSFGLSVGNLFGAISNSKEISPKRKDAEDKEKARWNKEQMTGPARKQRNSGPSIEASTGSKFASAAQKAMQGANLKPTPATVKYSAGEATAENVAQKPKFREKLSQPSFPNVSRNRRRHELPLTKRKLPEKRLNPRGVIRLRPEIETKKKNGTFTPVEPPQDVKKKKLDVVGHVNSHIEGTGYSTDSGTESSSEEMGVRKHRLMLPAASSQTEAQKKQRQQKPTQQRQQNQKKEKLVHQKVSAASKERNAIPSKKQTRTDIQLDQPHRKMQLVQQGQQNQKKEKLAHQKVSAASKGKNAMPSKIQTASDTQHDQPHKKMQQQHMPKEIPSKKRRHSEMQQHSSSKNEPQGHATDVSLSSGRQASVETGSGRAKTASEKNRTAATRQPSTAPRIQDSVSTMTSQKPDAAFSTNQRELSLRSRKRTTRLSLDGRSASSIKARNILQSAKNIWKKVVKDRELEKSELLRKSLAEKRDKVMAKSSSYYNGKLNGIGENQFRRIYPKRLRSSNEPYSKSESDFFCLPCNTGKVVDLRGFWKSGCKQKNQVVEVIDLHGAPPTLPPSVASIILKVNHTVKDEKVLSHVPYFGDDDFEDVISDLFDTEQRERRVLRGPAHEEDDKNEEIDETIRRLAVELGIAKVDELEKSGTEIQSAVSSAMKEDKARILERFKEVARNMRGKEHPEAKAESEPKSSDPVEARYLDTIDSFRALFCTRCFTYDCNKHGGAEEDHGGMEKPSLQAQYERGISRERESYWKESNEAFHCGTAFKYNDEKATELSEFQKGICSRLWLIFEGDIPKMAEVMRAPEKLVQALVDSEINSSPTYRAVVPVSKVDETGKKRNAMKNYHSMKNYNPKWLKRITNMEIHPYFTPCTHDGMCSEENCSCIQNGFFCIKSCVWGDKSPNFFRGCDCKGGCKKNSCACYAARRECDPDVCKQCGACTDPPNAPATKQSCRNDNICMRRHCRLLVGRSSVPEAGWGLFTKNELKKGDYVHEYIGEVVSQDEAERRGRLYDKENRSFLFNQSSEYVVDATRKGNKTRFANHSKKPNCDTRLLFVDGDARIGFFANENIPAQSELFIDYKYDSELNNDLIIKPGRTVDWMMDPKNAGKISKKRTTNRKIAT